MSPRCIALAAGFAYSRPDPSAADFYLALHNQLPLPLPLKGVVLHFVDDQVRVCVSCVLPPCIRATAIVGCCPLKGVVLHNQMRPYVYLCHSTRLAVRVGCCPSGACCFTLWTTSGRRSVGIPNNRRTMNPYTIVAVHVHLLCPPTASCATALLSESNGGVHIFTPWIPFCLLPMPAPHPRVMCGCRRCLGPFPPTSRPPRPCPTPWAPPLTPPRTPSTTCTLIHTSSNTACGSIRLGHQRLLRGPRKIRGRGTAGEGRSGYQVSGGWGWDCGKGHVRVSYWACSSCRSQAAKETTARMLPCCRPAQGGGHPAGFKPLLALPTGHTHASPGPPSTSGPTPTPLHPSPSQSQGPGTSLPPHEWSHFSVRLEPRCLGRLRAERAILLLSDHATVVFKLASFPPASAASPQPGVLTGPLLVPPQAHPYSSWAAGRHRGGGVSAQDHAAAPFRSIRVNSFSLPPAPGAPPPTSKPKGSEGTSTFSSPAVNPGQLSLMVQHLGPLPTLSYGLPSGLALLGEHAPLLAALAVPSNGRPLAGASLEFVIGRTTGALQPSDIVLVVDDTEGTRGLMALNNERYRVPLPTVAPGCRHTVRLWARSAAAGSAVVAAVLLCPAQVRACTGRG